MYGGPQMITQEDIEAMEDGMEDELLNKLCDERKENTSLMNRIDQLERELAEAGAVADRQACEIIRLDNILAAERKLADRLGKIVVEDFPDGAAAYDYRKSRGL